MDGFVGGDTELVSCAGRRLGMAASSIHGFAASLLRAVRMASGATGNAPSSATLDRCGAAWARMLDDLATQTEAVGFLADVGADDLSRAGS